jgi:adenylate cyclase
MAKDQTLGQLVVILHADIADSTLLVRHDEQLAHESIQNTFRHFSDIISKYQGRVHELRGDALLAEFERASDGVTAALAFQTIHSDYNAKETDENLPQVRVGIALGEVIIADSTITGAGVVLAQRLEQLAKPGEVVIQGAAYETIPERFPFEYENLGEHKVKGFDESIRAYRAILSEGELIPPPQEIKQQKVSGLSQNQVAGVLAIVLVAVLAAIYWLKPWESQVESASIEHMALPLPEKPSIAVLAFVNLSGDPSKTYLSDGISENIITALSRFSQLFVISRQSSFSYKDKPVTVKQVSEELGIRYVLEGSLQVSGDKLRVTAQLINALKGNHVWAENYDRSLEDIFEVQDEIISDIVATLKANIDLNEYERVKNKAPKSLNAFENFALASSYWFKYTKEDNQRALEYYEESRELDPDWAEAYRGIAWVHINGYRWGWSGTLSRKRSLELAFENAYKGVELAPFNHRLHQTLAEVLIQAGRLDEATAEYNQAIQLNPNDASVLAGATSILIFTGRSSQAVGQLKQAIRMNPYHPVWYLWNLGFAQYFIEDYEGAVESFMQMKKIPNLARRQLAAAYVGMGNVTEARAVIEEFLKNDPDYSIGKLRLNFKGKFSNPDDLERFVEDLRTAGLPE